MAEIDMVAAQHHCMKATNDTPDGLYKYLPAARASSILKDLLIRFSQVSVLNDALEFRPPLKGLATRSHLEETLKARLKTRYPHLVELAEKALPMQFQNEVISGAADEATERCLQSMQTIYEKLDRNVGILSLSETQTDTLLWSHYAEGGRGFLIEFDPKHLWFWGKREEDDDFHHIHRVTYASRRSPKYLLEITGDDILYTKGTEWEHEKEWRIIRSFRDAARKIGHDGFGKDILLFEIPSDCLLRVVIGYRASNEAIQQLRNIVASNRALSHLHFDRAMLTDDNSIRIISDR
jgi:hypothetical protein